LFSTGKRGGGRVKEGRARFPLLHQKKKKDRIDPKAKLGKNQEEKKRKENLKTDPLFRHGRRKGII